MGIKMKAAATAVSDRVQSGLSAVIAEDMYGPVNFLRERVQRGR